MFHAVFKANGETFEEYIINTFSYTLRETTSYWCHNYILIFHNYIFFGLTHMFCKCHQKTQNNEQIYMVFKNIKQGETKQVEVYYERIQKLAHGLQTPTTCSFFTIMF
jgi:hypothetical protein